MQLNHINLPVSDVATATAFFVKYFAFRLTATKGDGAIAVLENNENFVLVLMKDKPATVNTTHYPKAFHIGFLQPAEKAVTDLYEQLLAGGYDIPQAPKNIRDSFGFYFHMQQVMIEIATIGG